jgi:hypothetical protein
MSDGQLAQAVFDDLNKDRSAVVDRAKLCAELTIPYLYTEDGSSQSDDLTREYVQGYGAKIVNHLVGKFALSILPPSQPFYRLAATEEAMQAMTNGDDEMKYQVEKVLAIKEEGILRYINKSRFRKSLYPALKQAMVIGDSLIEKLEDEVYRVLNLKNYVVKRDAAGTIIELVIRESLKYETLPEDIKSEIKEEDKDSEIFLYTRTYLDDDGKYQKFQEVNEKIVAESEETLTELNDVYISVRWTKIDGEDYGRSFVEEHLGTLISLNKQLRVVNQSAVVSSKIVHTVNPNGMTKYSDFVNALNGDVIIGNETDIGTVQNGKGADLVPSMQLIQDYKRELAEAFLMSSASIRDAERVTAHEVQLVASELEASFGGIYTALADDIQIPLIENAMATLEIEGNDDVDVIITAGIEALGRNVELNKVNNLIQELVLLQGLIGEDEVKKIVNGEAFASSMVVNSGVAGKDFILPQSRVDSKEIKEKKDAVGDTVIQGAAAEAGKSVVNAQQ